MNPAAQATFGDSFEIGGDSPPEFMPDIAAARATGKMQESELKLRDRWFSVRTIADDEGAIIYTRDITRRVMAVRQLRQSEERYRKLVELFPDAVIVHQERRLVFANRAALTLFRAESADALLGRDLLELVHPCEHEAICERVESVSAGAQPPWRQVRMLRLDGEEVLCEKSGVSIEFGHQAAVQVIVRDMSERKRGEEALRASEERFRTIAEALPQLVYEIDVDGKPLYFNHRWHEYTGEQPGERNVRTELVHPDDRQHMAAVWKEANASGGLFEVEYRFRRHDGEYRWFLSRAFAVRSNTTGKILRWFGTSTDIHDLRVAREALQELTSQLEMRVKERTAALSEAMHALDQERRRFHEVLDMIPAYIILLSRDYRVPLANRYFEERFGKAEGHRCYEYLFNRAVPCENCESFKGFSTRAYHHWEWRGPDGRDYDIHDFPFTDVDGSQLIMEMGIDITERKSAEAALRDLNDTLEQRVAERTRELQRANQRLEQTDRRKNDFLATLSHELRNPLAPISNSLHVLDRATPGGDQARRAKEVLDRQVAHLSHLVNDLLDITRVSRNKIQLQRQVADLCEVVQRSVEDQRTLFEQHEITLEADIPTEPIIAQLDVTRVTQVVGNLLQNAAKFTKPGGLTRVSVERDSRISAIVRVRDTGVGIAAEILDNLFQPFTQADSTLERSEGGLGLGLALVKALIGLHGGEVSASSEGLGKGAEFLIRLPVEDRPLVQSRVRPERAARQPRRVLVIEDNVDAADSLRDVLELVGHTVAVAYDGHDGIARAREFCPDIVFCDIGLPGTDGYQVARTLRADPGLAHTCLIALSGYALPEDVHRAVAAGFDRHLAKPPNMEQVQEFAWDCVADRQKTANES